MTKNKSVTKPKRRNWGLLCIALSAFLLFNVFTCHLSTCSAQTAITNYTPGVTAEGAVYFLPKTGIRLNVLVEKTSYVPGDFCRFAQRYLRLNDVAQEPQVAYRVVAITQSAFPVADTTKAYALKFNPRTVAANVSLSADGCLQAINATPHTATEPAPFKAAPKVDPVNPRKYMSEEILAAGSTAKMAELTAREIYDLRENHNLLIKGQADFMPTDGAQLKLMLNRLDTQEQALLQLFQGTTTRDTVERVFTFVPDSIADHQVAFRLSQKLGLLDADDLSGVPYYMSIENLTALPAPSKGTTTTALKKKKVMKAAAESGVYVNVPGKMRVTVLYENEPQSVAEYPAGQFGNVELLSGELFNKHFTTHLWLNTISGAVERLDAEQPK